MSELKETEIGLIPKDWAIRTIDEIKAPVKHSIAMGPFGSNITKDNFVDEGIPVIRGNNLTGFYFGDSDFVFVTEKQAIATEIVLEQAKLFADEWVRT